MAEEPDLIVSNGYLGAGCSGDVPRIHVYHGTMIGDTRSEATVLPVRERLRRTLSAGATELVAGHCATKLVCVSESAAKEARRYYRVKVDAVIPNGVDTEVFAPRDQAGARARLGLRRDARYALFVGRLQHRKGSDLIQGAAQRAGFELLIAGTSGARGARHLGVLDSDALADAYAASDCVLFPTRYEACSFVVLEALACGRPLLTTRVGWMTTFLRDIPEYDALCITPTLEDVTTRLRTFTDIDTDRLASTARAYVLAHNSLRRYAEEWQPLLGGLRV